VAQVVKRLPSKHEALSSNHWYHQKKKKKNTPQEKYTSLITRRLKNALTMFPIPNSYNLITAVRNKKNGHLEVQG
jgi:hypothetical protein